MASTLESLYLVSNVVSKMFPSEELPPCWFDRTPLYVCDRILSLHLSRKERLQSPLTFFIVSCTLSKCANGTSSISFPSRFSYLIFSVVFSFFFMHACVLWCFPKVRTHAELASRDGSFWKWNRLFPRVTNGKRFPLYMVFRIWLICRLKVKFSLRREWPGRGRQQNYLLGSDRTADRIGSDRTGIFAFDEAALFWEKLCLIITQVTRNKKFEFSQQLGVWPITSPDTFGLFTGSTQIFSSELPVSLIKKNRFSCITRLKIHHQLEHHRKELLQLNSAGKFSVA